MPEVCIAIWDSLSPTYAKLPESQNEWCAVADVFKRKWQFPNA